jgi:competence protein ComEA
MRIRLVWRRGFVAAAVFGVMWVGGAGGLRVAAQAGSGQASSGPKQQTVAEKIAASKELLDINIATAEQLKALPGMGDAYAARVISGRPYSAKNQLTQRGILPQAAYDQIKDMIIAHRLAK